MTALSVGLKDLKNSGRHRDNSPSRLPLFVTLSLGFWGRRGFSEPTFAQIAPAWIYGLYERKLFRPRPTLDLFLPLNRRSNVSVVLVENEPVDVIKRGETRIEL